MPNSRQEQCQAAQRVRPGRHGQSGDRLEVNDVQVVSCATRPPTWSIHLYTQSYHYCLRSIHAQATSCATNIDQRVPTSQTLPEAYNCHSQAPIFVLVAHHRRSYGPVNNRALKKCGDPLGAERAPPPSSRIVQRDRRHSFEKDRDSAASLLCVYREP